MLRRYGSTRARDVTLKDVAHYVINYNVSSACNPSPFVSPARRQHVGLMKQPQCILPYYLFQELNEEHVTVANDLVERAVLEPLMPLLPVGANMHPPQLSLGPAGSAAPMHFHQDAVSTLRCAVCVCVWGGGGVCMPSTCAQRCDRFDFCHHADLRASQHPLQHRSFFVCLFVCFTCLLIYLLYMSSYLFAGKSFALRP
jgi:hypothetical protein